MLEELDRPRPKPLPVEPTALPNGVCALVALDFHGLPWEGRLSSTMHTPGTAENHRQQGARQAGEIISDRRAT
jgi:hypothetical protein